MNIRASQVGHKMVTKLNPSNHKSQQKRKTDSPIAVLSEVLAGAVIDASDLQIALQAISDAKERRESESLMMRNIT